MKLLLTSSFIALLSLTFAIVNPSQSTNTLNNLEVVLNSEFSSGGTACKVVKVNCGALGHSTNKACVKYTNGPDRAGALFLAHTIATQMGNAACGKGKLIKKATAVITQD